jgi:hypothetical protein
MICLLGELASRRNKMFLINSKLPRQSSDVWAQEEMDTLYWYYVQSKKSKDTVGSILTMIKDAAHKMKSRMAVIQQLLQQDIITLSEYEDLMKFEDSQYEQEVKIESSSGSMTRRESGIDMSETSESQSDDITVRSIENRIENFDVIKVFFLSSCVIAC